MQQKTIRNHNGSAFKVDEASEWLKELNDRTQSEDEGYNSIAELGNKVKVFENNQVSGFISRKTFAEIQALTLDVNTAYFVLDDETYPEKNGTWAFDGNVLYQSAPTAETAARIAGDEALAIEREKTAALKLDKKLGSNLNNPDDFRVGTFYYPGSTTPVTGNNAYGSTGYIPADVAGLITTGAGTSAQGLASHIVFDANKVRLRNVVDTNQYTYVAGDGYVVFVYVLGGNPSFAKSTAVCVGTAYSFEKFTLYKPLLDLESKVSSISKNSIKDLSNGVKEVYAGVADFNIGAGLVDRNITDNYFTYYKLGTGNSWIYTPEFNPIRTNLVHIKFNVKFTRVGVHSKGFTVVLAEQTSTGGATAILKVVTLDGDYDIIFNPADYTNYSQFRIWINNETMVAGQSISAKISDFEVLEYVNPLELNNLVGETAKELFKSVDETFDSLNVNKINNLVTSTYGDTSNFQGTPLTARFLETNSLTYFRQNSGNTWIYSPEFTPLLNGNLVHVKFTVAFTKTGGYTGGFKIYIAEETSVGGLFTAIATMSSNGTYDITFDPSLYPNYAQFRIWLSNETSMIDGQSLTAVVTNLKVEQNNSLINSTKIVGENVKELFESVEVNLNEKPDNNIVNFLNGNDFLYSKASNFLGGAKISENLETNSLTFKRTGTGNTWIYSSKFSPTTENLIHISFDLAITRTGSHTAGFVIYVANKIDVSDKFIAIAYPTTDGTYDITFDPANFVVYNDFSTDFYIWISNQSMSEVTDILEADFTNLRVYETIGKANTVNFEGSNIKELAEGIDTQITNVKSLVNAPKYTLNPSLEKFEIAVTTGGSVVAIPIIPNSASFFGNSLIGGFGFGMAASAENKDYYYLVNEYIKTIKPSFTNARNSVGTLETISRLTDETDAELIIRITPIIQTNFLDLLVGTENLILLQIGDNVNTTARRDAFEVALTECLRLVRLKCQSARVFVMGMWYANTQNYTSIQSACTTTGSTFINIGDLAIDENRSAIGNVSVQTATADRTLLGVTNVVENTSTNITVTFEVSAVSYVSTIDVVSYSLSATTLSYNSTNRIIDNSGIGSHPGDLGFKAITNRFLYESKINGLENTYI